MQTSYSHETHKDPYEIANQQIQEYLAAPRNLYQAAFAATFTQIVTPTSKGIDESETTDVRNNAYAELFIATAGDEDSPVAEAALTMMQTPAAKWQAAMRLVQQTDHMPERFIPLLTRATAEAQADTEQREAITRVNAALGLHLGGLVMMIAHEMGIEEEFEASLSRNEAVLASIAVSNQDEIAPADPVDAELKRLQGLLEEGLYLRAMDSFESMMCFSGVDDMVRLRAAGLMMRCKVAERKANDLFQVVSANLQSLMRSNEEWHDDVQYTHSSMVLREVALETLSMAAGLHDVRDRAVALLTCKARIGALNLPGNLVLANGRSLDEELQSAWTRWAHILPGDPEREKWTEQAMAYGVDMAKRYPQLPMVGVVV